MKSAAFPALIFTKHMNAQQHYMQISDANFHSNNTTNMETTDKNPFISLRKVWFSTFQF
jgi:hypothetical protein